jgi:FKBP-type peptidyl-prolyl cis-trans isomerase
MINKDKMMKRTLVLTALAGILIFAPIAMAGEKSEPSTINEKKEITVMESADLIRQISYALGYDIFENVSKYMELDLKNFMMGVNDSHTGEMKMEKDQMRQVLMTYQRMARQKKAQIVELASKENRTKGAVFLESNKLKEGVVSLSSGLQYKILEKGDGTLPGPTDTVECHYKGSLLDGTVFDSSFSRGKPATFQVGGVIKGWIEALQLMPVGSRWELYIPADLAYGNQGAGQAIKPGQTLIFEVELLGIIE